MRPLLPLLPLLLLTACASTTTRGPSHGGGGLVIEQTVFPAKDELARIAAAPVPAKIFDESAKDVPTWDLVGPLPDAIERAPAREEPTWGKLLAEAAAPRGDAVLVTEAMRCVAREHAAFYLANGAMPAEALTRFMAARCGAPTGQVGAAYQVIRADPRIPDEQLFTQFRAQTKTAIEKTVKAGRLEAGIAWVRKGGQAVVALAVLPQTVQIERTPLVPGPDGNVVLRGTILGPTGALRATINRGKHGYADCSADPTVALPRFVVTCPTSREDEVAWLTISALPPGRALGTPALEALVWPAGAPGKTYARLARAGGGAAGAAPAEMLEEVNRVRAEAKLPPLRLAEAESRTAERLAPHFFGAFDGNGDETVADQVALGLLAGWEVDGMVRHGNFISTRVTDAGSWAEVVRAALARPSGRAALLDPAAERLAIGPVATGQARGAVVASYALFDAYRHEGDVKLLASRLGALRAARGTAPARFVVELNADADLAAKQVQAGLVDAKAALDALLGRASDRLGRSVRGWVAETTSLDRMKLPDELGTMPALTLGVGVGHVRHPGHAWGRFVVMMVLVDESVVGPSTARHGGPHGG